MVKAAGLTISWLNDGSGAFKYEEAYLTQYNNIREARKAIGKYVHTYNFERCHSALNNQTPASCYYPILLLDDHAA